MFNSCNGVCLYKCVIIESNKNALRYPRVKLMHCFSADAYIFFPEMQICNLDQFFSAND